MLGGGADLIGYMVFLHALRVGKDEPRQKGRAVAGRAAPGRAWSVTVTAQPERCASDVYAKGTALSQFDSLSRLWK